jgi:hypothetical protein
VDNRVHIGAEDHTARVALAQYIARAPLALEKLSYLPSQGTVRYTSDFNPANGDTIKVWDSRDFIAAATLFIPWAAAVSIETARAPPQGVRLIRYYVKHRFMWSRARKCRKTKARGPNCST